jgi:4-amino-4-deoxychorismate lyase
MTSQEPDYQLFSSLRFDPILLQSSSNSALGNGPSSFYMLSYHRDRMLQAAQHFRWTAAAARIEGPEGLAHLLRTLEGKIDLKSNASFRVKTVLHHNGDITVETSQTPKVPLENLFPARIPPPAPEMKVSPLTGGTLSLGEGNVVIKGRGTHDPQQLQPWTVMVDSRKTVPSPFTTYKTTYRDMYNEARARVGIETMAEPQEVLIVSSSADEIMEGSLTSCFFWRGGRWVTPPISSGGQAGTTRRWLLEKGFCEEEAVTSVSLVDGEECWISNGVRGLSWGKIKL